MFKNNYKDMQFNIRKKNAWYISNDRDSFPNVQTFTQYRLIKHSISFHKCPNEWTFEHNCIMCEHIVIEP